VVTDLSNRRRIDIQTTKRANIAGRAEHLLNGGTNHALNYASSDRRWLLRTRVVTDPANTQVRIARLLNAPTGVKPSLDGARLRPVPVPRRLIGPTYVAQALG